MTKIKKAHTITTFIIITLLSVGCATQTPNPTLTPNLQDQTFKFSSGGAYHPEGFGAWQVTLDAKGLFSVGHDLYGDVTPYGPFTLTPAENQTLWMLINNANLNELPPTFQRPGQPDEVAYSLSLNSATQTHTIEIWVADTRKNLALANLIKGIATLLETYTGQTPIM